MTDEERAWSHALLVRRSTKDPEEIADYVVFAPREEVSLGAVAGVAGTRWRIEEGFEQAKGVCGLDEYEVRKYEAWHRHITLSLLAHAFLAAVAPVAVAAKEQKKGIQQATGPSTGPSKTGGGELIPLTVPEAQRLTERLLWKKAPRAAAVIHGSLWRRHHQYQARECHYRRRSGNAFSDTS